MSEITRRDLYICAYIAQGMSYEQAVFTFENKGADAALAAAGENESETDFVMNHPLYKDMQAEIARLRGDPEDPVVDLTENAVFWRDVARERGDRNAELTAEIARLTADNAGLTISRDVHRTECLRLVHEHGKLTDEIASLKRQA